MVRKFGTFYFCLFSFYLPLQCGFRILQKTGTDQTKGTQKIFGRHQKETAQEFGLHRARHSR